MTSSTNGLTYRTKWTIGIAVFVGLAVLGQIMKRHEPTRSISPTAPVTQKPQFDVNAMMAENEAKRQKAVNEGLQEGRAIVADASACGTPKQIADAWTKLKQVRKSDAQWADAVGLTNDLEGCRAKSERALSSSLQQLMIDQRQEWARRMETRFLDQGMDVSVTLSGATKNAVTFQWLLMSRVTLHQMTDGDSRADGSLLGSLEKLGFNKATFKDGADFGIIYELIPSSEKNAGVATLIPLGLGAPLTLQ